MALIEALFFLQMKIFLCCVFLGFLLINGITKAENQNDLKDGNDTIAVLGVSGKLQIANAGFAPIPAFSFNKPIGISSIALRKKRFTYEPDFAVGLNGEPWMINNRLTMKIIDKKKVHVKVGINPSLFFESKPSDSGKDVLRAQRNVSFDINAEYNVGKQWTLNFTVLHNNACDPDALSGNFFLLSGSLTPVSVSKLIYFDLKQEVFYFDFSNLHGLCTSTIIRVAHHRIPVSIFGQGVIPLWTNFTGNNFKWNTGLTYSF